MLEFLNQSLPRKGSAHLSEFDRFSETPAFRVSLESSFQGAF
jgi:hypothetical protein